MKYMFLTQTRLHNVQFRNYLALLVARRTLGPVTSLAMAMLHHDAHSVPRGDQAARAALIERWLPNT